MFAYMQTKTCYGPIMSNAPPVRLWRDVSLGVDCCLNLTRKYSTSPDCYWFCLSRLSGLNLPAPSYFLLTSLFFIRKMLPYYLFQHILDVTQKIFCGPHSVSLSSLQRGIDACKPSGTRRNIISKKIRKY